VRTDLIKAIASEHGATINYLAEQGKIKPVIFDFGWGVAGPLATAGRLPEDWFAGFYPLPPISTPAEKKGTGT